MRFSTIIVGTFAAVAAAQSSSAETPAPSSDAPSGTSVAAPSSATLSPAQESQASCLKACDVKDVNCQAKCLGNPTPSDSDANDTIACVTACPTSDGSEAGNKAWGECNQKCVDEKFFPKDGGSGSGSGSSGSGSTPTQSGGAKPTGGSGTEGGNSTDGSGKAGDNSNGGKDSPSSTGKDGAQESGKPSSAGKVGFSVVAFLAAFIAL